MVVLNGRYDCGNLCIILILTVFSIIGAPGAFEIKIEYLPFLLVFCYHFTENFKISFQFFDISNQ